MEDDGGINISIWPSVPAAVVALVLGLLSFLAMADYWLVAVPIVGVIWAIVALRQIRSSAG